MIRHKVSKKTPLYFADVSHLMPPSGYAWIDEGRSPTLAELEELYEKHGLELEAWAREQHAIEMEK